MDERDFPFIGPNHRRPDPEWEPLLRGMHRLSVPFFGSDAPRALGEPRLVKVGYAKIPMLQIEVSCRRDDMQGLLPTVRHRAFAFIAAHDVSDEHLLFVPSVMLCDERRRAFTDQFGNRRFGQRYTVSFDLSGMLTSAIYWTWTGHGTLPTTSELVAA